MVPREWLTLPVEQPYNSMMTFLIFQISPHATARSRPLLPNCKAIWNSYRKKASQTINSIGKRNGSVNLKTNAKNPGVRIF